MTQPFNGLGLGMGNLARLSRAKSRSISAENFTGAKGAGGMATEGTGAVAATAPVPSVAMPPAPFAPVKFSALIERDFARERRARFPMPRPRPLNGCVSR